MTAEKRITSFQDLQVYQATYEAMKIVIKQLLPQLPISEQADLKDQMSRACKAIPRLIAEGYAKKHQKTGFQKYIDDAMAECNEMVVSVSQCRDLYPEHVDIDLCNKLIDDFDKAGRQLFKLGKSWTNFKRERNDTSESKP